MVGKTRLLWIIFSIFLLVIVLCVGTVGGLALKELHTAYRATQRESLTAAAQLIRQQAAGTAFAPAGQGQASQLARVWGAAAGARVTLILPDGRVIGDSEEDPARMENHADRPEVQAALNGANNGAVQSDVRFSHTLRADLLYVAVPVTPPGQERPVVGVVRVARSLAEIAQKEEAIKRALWHAGLLAAALAALFSLYLSRRMSRPIEQIRHAAERYAAGDYSRRLFMPGPAEFADLAKAMNRMAREMNRRIREITQQRNEREAILTSMREGVLAVDRDERIMMLNRSAEALLGIAAPEVIGRLVQETMRHAELQRFLDKALAGEPLGGEECLLHWSGGRLLQLESAPLRDAEGTETGLLVVFNDVTRLTRLENMRREFVANVSHELRTPITSIKGFIETLRDGAINDPEYAGRFLEIIGRQADRLNAIIEDLLALSRVERGTEERAIEFKCCPLRPLLEALAQHFTPQREEKKIQLLLECPADLQVKANAQLLEQAIGNLIDNAIKYSPAGKTIRVTAQPEEERVVIRVADEGPGIEPQHLPRLFERFYRVDPARSRAVGGTGLGLAIVKHIAQAHGGQVTVQSEWGKGSVFSIELPDIHVLTKS